MLPMTTQTPLTDIQFVSKFNTSFAECYEKAKNLYFDAPIHTLVELRGLLVILCDEIIDEYKIKILGNSLYEKQDGIHLSESFRPSIIDYINLIRDAGNKAAHREKYDISYGEYQKLALETLKTFCALVEDYWGYKTSKVPSYTFATETDSFVKEWCYQALFHNDKNAKFEVAMALFNKYHDQFKDKDKYLIEQSSLIKSIDLIEEAAMDLHPEALFEYSHIILNQIHREKDIEKAKGHLYTSACRDFIKSKVAYGQLIYDSEEPYSDEIEVAVSFLEDAATDGESQAQFLLSQIYSSSKFGLKSDKLSSQWFEMSIKSRNANAIFIQASSTLNDPHSTQEDIDQSIQRLKLAIEKGSRDAYKLYLKILIDLSLPAETVKPIYESYLKLYPDDYQIYLNLTEYLFKKGKSDINLMEEAIKNLIALVRREDISPKIKRKCNTLSPKWLIEFEKTIRVLNVFDKVKHAKLFANFKADGTPYDDSFDLVNNMILLSEKPELADKLLYKTILSNKTEVTKKRLGRNVTCYCGSGLKFKKCCG